jgi:hypothetical protein
MAHSLASEGKLAALPVSIESRFPLNISGNLLNVRNSNNQRYDFLVKFGPIEISSNLLLCFNFLEFQGFMNIDSSFLNTKKTLGDILVVIPSLTSVL